MEEDGVQPDSWLVSSSVQPLFRSQLSPSADLVVAVFLTFTGVLSVLGNGTVLLVACRKRKKLKPPELMTVNLAICDFGFTLLGSPFFITASLCHAWVFGETGCLYYGIQGFVFGIGSLLTTCLISVDRCLKICSLRYGRWLERRHVFVSLLLLWIYTLFWAFLPVIGFGHYGPEPYGTSCTINWWRMKSSLSDRIYIFLILILCFGLPSFIIIASYVSILITVYRSNRTLASIPSSSVSHSSKDLRLAKIAAVVCATFLLAWTPYATVSLMSALALRGDHEAESQHADLAASNSDSTAVILDAPWLLNWTDSNFYRKSPRGPEKSWSEVNNISSTPQDSRVQQMSLGLMVLSSFPPVVSLIPALFAKSHCMINPLIYQIMNRDFRGAVFELVFGQEMTERRQMKRREEILFERNVSISYSQGWRGKRSRPSSMSEDSRQSNRKNHRKLCCSVSRDSFGSSKPVDAGALDMATVDIQRNVERQW